MRIAVTDACIFIDLIKYNIINHFFELSLEIHTSIEVWEELEVHHHQVLSAYRQVGKLSVYYMTEEDIRVLGESQFPKGLSFQDRTVIFLALKLDALIISSDSLVRKTVGRKIEIHGLIWVVEQLVIKNNLTKQDAVQTLKVIYEKDIYYFNNEELRSYILNLINEWEK